MAATLVQSRTAQASRGQTSLVFSPNPFTAGNCLLLSLCLNNWIDRDGVITPSVSNGAFGTPVGGGVTWVRLTTFTSSDTMVDETWLGLGSVGAAGSLSVPITWTLGPGPCAVIGVVAEFSGVTPLLSQPDNLVRTLGATSGTRDFPQPTVTSLRNYDLLYGAWNTAQHLTTLTFPNPAGFAEIATVTTNFNPGLDGYEAAIGVGWRNADLAGTYSPQWQKTGSPSFNWTGAGVALKLAGVQSLLAGTSNGVSDDFAMMTAPTVIYVPPVVIDVPDRWLFAGVDLSTYAITKTRALNADSHPAVRGQNQPLSNLSGRQFQTKVSDSRVITIDMYVHSMSASGTEHQATQATWARTNLDALQALLALRSQQTLVRVMPDGTGRLAMAEVWAVRSLDASQRLGGTVFGLSVDFYLSDPYFYSVTQVDGPRSLVSASVAYSIVNPGTVRGHQLLFEVLGPVTNPRVTNITTGVWFQYTGAVPNGQRLFVDCLSFSAYLAGANVVGNMTHFGSTPFMVLEPGTNSLVATSTGGGGSLTTTLQPRYV